MEIDGLGTPKSMIGPKADRPMAVIVEIGDHLRQGVLRRRIGLGGPLAHALAQRVEGQRRRLLRCVRGSGRRRCVAGRGVLRAGRKREKGKNESGCTALQRQAARRVD